MPALQSKHWPFTWYPAGDLESWNTDSSADIKGADALIYLKDLVEAKTELVSYCVAQCEFAPSTGRLHVQGYLQLTNRWTFTRVKKLVFTGLLATAQIAAARGSAEQNESYCSKEDTRVPGTETLRVGLMVADVGENHQPGKSLDRVYADIKLGASMEDIVEKYGFGMFVRHERSLKSAMCTWGKRRCEPAKIILLIGPTRSGKSRWVEREYPDRYRMTFGNGGNSAWFDGYNGESTIELSEFRGQLTLSFMLDLLDRYQLKVQTKGGTVQFLASTIIITSNEEPRDWYKALEDRDEKMKPLLARVEEFGVRPRYQTENRIAGMSAENGTPNVPC